MALDELFEQRDGRPISRLSVCAICGSNFTQRLLSDRFLAIARHGARRIGQEAAIDIQIPDGYVPVFCNPCEHRDLSSITMRRLPPPKITPAIEKAYEADERAAMQEAS